MNLVIYTDGGSFGNPGPSAYGYVIQDKGGKILHEEGGAIGHATNNIAEYTALIRALEKVIEMRSDKNFIVDGISVFADSQLMIQQVKRLYKVKKPHIIKLMDEVRALITKLSIPIEFTHIPREENERADSLVKSALGR